MKRVGITVYGCEKDEAEVFHKISPGFGVVPTIINNPVSSCGEMSSCGNQCISVSHKSVISKSSLCSLKKAGVRYISTRSIGYDHIDMEAAKSMEITIGTVTYSPDSVADYTLMLMLMAIRGAKPIVTGAEKYDYRLDEVRGKELRDMTVGVIGTGRIGKAVARRLQGFGCRVLTCNRSRETGCVPLDDLLEKSDMITLHTPLNQETFHMIGSEQMKRIKQGAFIVNTGRGALVDTGALVKALETGKLSGAALDVLEGEEGIFYYDCSQRPIDNQYLLQLQKMPNVIISPHTAYYTNRALYDTVEKTILNCLDFERSQNHA